jgi:hypothetical protein
MILSSPSDSNIDATQANQQRQLKNSHTQSTGKNTVNRQPYAINGCYRHPRIVGY